MKKAIYIALFFPLISLSINAQTSGILGLGKFKINTTDISIIDEISKEYNEPVYEMRELVKPYKYSKDPNRIYEIKKDTVNYNSSESESTECPDVKVFYISTYKIAGILVEDIYLVFEKNKLIRIRCSSKELYEALKIKYPKFTEKTQTEKTSCVEESLKDPRFASDYTFTTKWLGNGISCEVTQNYFYTDDCKLLNVDKCEIFKLPRKYYFKCDELIQKKREFKIQNAKKTTLKDL